jgi:hypothetical protein
MMPRSHFCTVCSMGRDLVAGTTACGGLAGNRTLDTWTAQLKTTNHHRKPSRAHLHVSQRDQKIDLAVLEDAERGIHVPSLPLELWLLIFSQHTDSKHLWINGRQVCSTWRSEIPKVIAKKYLEDPQMTQIHASCASAKEKHLACLMGQRLCFSHYEGKTRAVFNPRERKRTRTFRFSQE